MDEELESHIARCTRFRGQETGVSATTVPSDCQPRWRPRKEYECEPAMRRAFARMRSRAMLLRQTGLGFDDDH